MDLIDLEVMGVLSVALAQNVAAQVCAVPKQAMALILSSSAATTFKLSDQAVVANDPNGVSVAPAENLLVPVGMAQVPAVQAITAAVGGGLATVILLRRRVTTSQDLAPQ